MLNTQKIHDQLKRLRKSPKKKQLSHMHNESSFTTIDEHNCVAKTSSLYEKVKNKSHTKLKSKTSKSKSKNKNQIDRKKNL
jgi:hypothetical protein